MIEATDLVLYMVSGANELAIPLLFTVYSKGAERPIQLVSGDTSTAPSNGVFSMADHDHVNVANFVFPLMTTLELVGV